MLWARDLALTALNIVPMRFCLLYIEPGRLRLLVVPRTWNRSSHYRYVTSIRFRFYVYLLYSPPLTASTSFIPSSSRGLNVGLCLCGGFCDHESEGQNSSRSFPTTPKPPSQTLRAPGPRAHASGCVIGRRASWS